MAVIAPDPGAAAALADEALARQRTPLNAALDFCRRKPLGTIGLVIVLVMFAAGGFADWLAPFASPWGSC